MKDTKKISAGTIKRVYVNKHIIKANEKNGTSLPPLTIKCGRKTIKCRYVFMDGPSTLGYKPYKPLNCGATVWIFTTAELTYI